MSRRGLIRGERRHQATALRLLREDSDAWFDRYASLCATAASVLRCLLPRPSTQARRRPYILFRGRCCDCRRSMPVSSWGVCMECQWAEIERCSRG